MFPEYMSENPYGRRDRGDARYPSGNDPYSADWRDAYGGTRRDPYEGDWRDPYERGGPGAAGGWRDPYGGDPGPGFSAGQSTRLSPDAERSWAILSHAAAPVAMLVSAGSLSILGPLLVWALYKDQSTYVRRAAASSFNFNLILWVMTIIGWGLVFTILLAPIGVLLLALSLIGTFVFHVLAAIDASRGRLYRYPAGIPILS